MAAGFPLELDVNTDAIDSAVRSFAVAASGVLDAIQSGLDGLVNLFKWLLAHIPWFILLALVFVLGWKSAPQAAQRAFVCCAFICRGACGHVG